MKSAYSLLRLIRPTQWLKNLMLFFPPFLSGSLSSAGTIIVTGIISFASFSCIASAVYVFNDLCDAERDSSHPVKRLRPLPSGEVSKNQALILVVSLVVIGFACAVIFAPQVVKFLLLYVAVTTGYSLWLKHIPVVDLFCITAGFMIRLLAGGVVFTVKISEWLFLSVFFLSLFLSTGKRLSEQNLLGVDSGEHRGSLKRYSRGALDGILYITAATSLVTYTMYSLAHPQLVYSVPLCTFGLFRYIIRIKGGSSGDPTESLLKDIPLLCVSVLWVVQVGWSIYW
jgi:4-hydroxybenzoate polyprenyltransferase